MYVYFSIPNIFSFSFFLLNYFCRDICPFVDPLAPLFWTSGDVSSGFQRQSGQPYSHSVEADEDLLYIDL